MALASARPQLLYFCDETGTSEQEYLAVGGVAIRAERANEIRSDLRDICQQCSVPHEVKWSNTKARRDNVHKAFVDYLFSLIDEGMAHFHIRFSRMSDYNHQLSGMRRKIDTISKAYFQLLLHRPGQYYSEDCDIFVHPDNGDCTSLLLTHKGALNAHCVSRYGSGSFRHIAPRDSKNESILQMLDVTLGALGAVRNGRDIAPGTAEAKRELAQYVFGKTGLTSLGGNSPRTERRLSVWNATPMWQKVSTPS